MWLLIIKLAMSATAVGGAIPKQPVMFVTQMGCENAIIEVEQRSPNADGKLDCVFVTIVHDRKVEEQF